jgi:hypothetical protein
LDLQHLKKNNRLKFFRLSLGELELEYYYRHAKYCAERENL